MMMSVSDQERPTKQKPFRERLTEKLEELLEALEQALSPAPALVPVRARGARRHTRR
jgi:hypothetical protein